MYGIEYISWCTEILELISLPTDFVGKEIVLHIPEKQNFKILFCFLNSEEIIFLELNVMHFF